MQNHQYRYAITRLPSPSMAEGITTQTARINLELAQRQHKQYVDNLRKLGVDVTVLEPLAEFPDSHFVEDVAIIYKDVAILTRPGAEARRGEVDQIRPVLQSRFKVRELSSDENVLLDGGDVLFCGNKVLIGISKRTNDAGAKELGAILTELNPNLSIHFIFFDGVLHLKSGLVALSDETLLANPQMKLHTQLPIDKIKWLPKEEGFAANALVVNGSAFVFHDSPAAEAAAIEAMLNLLN